MESITNSPSQPTQPTCQNCDTPLQGEFCHNCGQNKATNIKFFGDIIFDLLGNFFSYDSKVNQTVFPLLFRPGFLAKDYIDGHRIKYISPFRLYLFISLLFFIVLSNSAMVQMGNPEDIETDFGDAAAEDTLKEDSGFRYQPGDAITGSESEAITGDQNKTDSGSSDSLDNKQETKPEAEEQNLLFKTTEEDRINMSFFSDETNELLTAKMKKLRALPPEQQMNLLFDSAALTIFIMLPIFALILKVLYLFSNRLYVEHMIVALYSQSFVFLIWTIWLGLAALEEYLIGIEWHTMATITDYLITVIWWWFAIYLLLNLKNIYQQGWWMTSFKAFTVGTIYFVLAVMTIAVAAFWTLVTTNA